MTILRGASGTAPPASSCSGLLLAHLLGRRVRKARALFDAIGRFPDSHGAFCLLRSCSGWAKVLYSCRTVPPDAQSVGLRDADTDIRLALGRLVGSPLSDDDWRLASLGITSGGVGARSASEHAPAAYVVSFAACRDLSCVIWPSFDPLDLDEGCRFCRGVDPSRHQYLRRVRRPLPETSLGKA